MCRAIVDWEGLLEFARAFLNHITTGTFIFLFTKLVDFFYVIHEEEWNKHINPKKSLQNSNRCIHFLFLISNNKVGLTLTLTNCSNFTKLNTLLCLLHTLRFQFLNGCLTYLTKSLKKKYVVFMLIIW